MTRQNKSKTHFSIEVSVEDSKNADGIFRNPDGLRSVGSSRTSAGRGPSLPVSLPQRRWYNFHGFFQPEQSEYDFSFRRHKHRTRFLFVFFVCLIIIAIYVTILYNGGEEVEGVSSTVVPHHAYTIAQQMLIPEIQAEMVLYRHKRTQAEVLTIIPRDLDQDAVFGLSVKTLAKNDRGAAHVLMHSLWDGSEAYPLKDQVHTYHKGSMATWVDATCLEDRTLYTVASRSATDLVNLMSLLLDALFHPLVKVDKYTNAIFREEGWRLDPVDQSNFNASNQDLLVNGQALTLQKATYNNVDEMMTRYARRALFGNTHYQFDARGVPMDLIDLNAVDLLKYYDEHYVATNTQVFLYGSSQAIQTGLQAFDDSTQHQRSHLDTMEKSLPQWQGFSLKEPAEEIHAYAIQQGDIEASHTMVSWLLNDSHMSHKTQFAWLALEYLLVATPISILRQSLEGFVQTALVNMTQFTPVVIGALDTEYQQWRFSVVVKGIPSDHVQKLQNRIDFILGNIASFDSDAVAAAMNIVEMRYRDLGSGSQPRGVLLFHRALTEWNYNREAVDSLAWAAALQEFKDEIAKNGNKILVEMVQQKLVHNNHMVRIRLDPSFEELGKQDKAELRRIRLMRETLSKDAFQTILEESRARQVRQASPVDADNYSMLPKLELRDLPKANAQRESRFSIRQQILMVETPVVFSFGMLFVDLGVDIRSLKYENVALLPLVYRLMLRSGTELYDSDNLMHQIGKFSSGITVESMVLDVRQKDYNGPLQFSVHDGVHLATKTFFRGSCMAENLEGYFGLLTQIMFHGLMFQKDVVIDVINTLINEMEAKIASSSVDLVASRLAARHSYHGLILEQLSGMYQLKSLNAFLTSATSTWDDFSIKLNEVKTALVGAYRSGMIISLTGENDILVNVRPVLENFLSAGLPRPEGSSQGGNPGQDPHPWVEQLNATRNQIAPLSDEAMVFPMSVNYVGKAGRVFLPGVPVNGGVAVAAKYLQRVYLYKELHDKQGASNVVVDFSFRHGTLQLISLEDPSVLSTLEVFDKAASSLHSLFAANGFSADAQSAIFGTIADLDGASKQPDEIGWNSIVNYLQDDNADFAQFWRNQILNASLADFLGFFQAVEQWTSSSVAIVTDSETFVRLTYASNLTLVKVCPHLVC